MTALVLTLILAAAAPADDAAPQQQTPGKADVPVRPSNPTPQPGETAPSRPAPREEPASRECGLQPCTPDVPRARPPRRGQGLRAAAIPVIAYASDTGLRLAGGLFLYDLKADGSAGAEVRADWAAIQLSWTSKGPRYAEVKGELRDIRGTRLRSFYQLKVNDDVAAPYWGEGAHLDGGASPGNGSPPPAFSYHVAGPWLAASLRGPIDGPLAWFTRARWTRRNISQRGSALEAQRPPGYEGGGTAVLGAGVVYDTRDDEIGVTRGLFADASVFAAPQWNLWGISEYPFAGVNVTSREYLPLWRGGTLALRQLYENKVGDVPFTERTLIEGLGYGEGIGGAGTIRGLARDRLAGEEKMLGSVELRAHILETSWFGRTQDFGVSIGGDVGRARQRGRSPESAGGAFAGLRLVWDRAVLVRFEVGDAGYGPAYYLSFDEPF